MNFKLKHFSAESRLPPPTSPLPDTDGEVADEGHGPDGGGLHRVVPAQWGWPVLEVVRLEAVRGAAPHVARVEEVGAHLDHAVTLKQ